MPWYNVQCDVRNKLVIATIKFTFFMPLLLNQYKILTIYNFLLTLPTECHCVSICLNACLSYIKVNWLIFRVMHFGNRKTTNFVSFPQCIQTQQFLLINRLSSVCQVKKQNTPEGKEIQQDSCHLTSASSKNKSRYSHNAFFSVETIW